MENKEKLYKRLSELEANKKTFSSLLENFNFKTKEESDNYINSNKIEFDKLKIIVEEIKEIKWLLMTPKEQQEHLAYLEVIKNKYSEE